jgi:hypothetical protein
VFRRASRPDWKFRVVLEHFGTYGPLSLTAISSQLAKTHAHWIVLTDPITNANRFEFFATPPDTSLLPPLIPNDPANPADPATKLDLRRLSHDELCAYAKSVIGHSHDLVGVLKAQRLQIRLGEMVIKWLQWQVYQKDAIILPFSAFPTLPIFLTHSTPAIIPEILLAFTVHSSSPHTHYDSLPHDMDSPR